MMLNKPKVSVIMSVYNGEKYLREAVDSILNQTFKDFEFIIINDGSTDKTSEILENYNDPRIVIINNQENIGLTKSLNKGLKIAKGEYIARMDADDVSLPERLEKMVNFLNKNNDIGLLGSSFIIVDEKGRELKTYRFVTGNNEIKKKLLSGNYFGSEMFRSACLEKVGFYREEFRYAQDYDLCLRIAEFWDVANIAEPLYNLRVNLQSISIVNKFEQERYASLARILANQRKKYGKEKLDISNKEKVEDILNRILPRNKHNVKKVLADGYFHGADLFYFAGKYLKAIRWLLKSLGNKFFYVKSWILLLKIVICLFLSPKIIKGLKFIRKRFSHLLEKK